MPKQYCEMDCYFERIGYSGSGRVSYDTLCDLHTLHTFHIPFENYDLFLGKPVSLSTDALFSKMVMRQRGGYCFEMNGLFSFVLKKLGYKVTNLMARVCDANLARLHQLLLIDMNGKKYIGDAGFGGNGLIAPLPLEVGCDFKQYNDVFRIERNDKYGYSLGYLLNGNYEVLYYFTLEEYLPLDYEIANYVCLSTDYTILKKHKICTKPTPTGRVTLFDNELRLRINGVNHKHVMKSEEEYSEILQKYFNMML